MDFGGGDHASAFGSGGDIPVQRRRADGDLCEVSSRPGLTAQGLDLIVRQGLSGGLDASGHVVLSGWPGGIALATQQYYHYNGHMSTEKELPGSACPECLAPSEEEVEGLRVQVGRQSAAIRRMQPASDALDWLEDQLRGNWEWVGLEIIEDGDVALHAKRYGDTRAHEFGCGAGVIEAILNAKEAIAQVEYEASRAAPTSET